jgi:epoxyqueuosine reductase
MPTALSETKTRTGAPGGAALKRKIEREARRLGASLVGFAPVSRWAEFGDVPPAYHPTALWEMARGVIVLGVPMLLPVLESTPSINYQEMYNASNVLLDQIAYRLCLFLNELGHASIPLPRDGYGNLEILLKKMPGCFSHVFAGKYAGLGTVAYSHNLVNPEYGPRARYVSIFTAAELPGSPMLEKDLCNKCLLCERLCPARAFITLPDKLIAGFDAIACTKHHQELVKESRFPCGVCAKVCPVGRDRKLYKRTRAAAYLEEYAALKENPADPRYAHLAHIRSHGSSGER